MTSQPDNPRPPGLGPNGEEWRIWRRWYAMLAPERARDWIGLLFMAIGPVCVPVLLWLVGWADDPLSDVVEGVQALLMIGSLWLLAVGVCLVVAAAKIIREQGSALRACEAELGHAQLRAADLTREGDSVSAALEEARDRADALGAEAQDWKRRHGELKHIYETRASWVRMLCSSWVVRLRKNGDKRIAYQSFLDLREKFARDFAGCVQPHKSQHLMRLFDRGAGERTAQPGEVGQPVDGVYVTSDWWQLIDVLEHMAAHLTDADLSPKYRRGMPPT